MPEPSSRRILLVATMRDEGPFIAEWVAYHRGIGFTDILVCTNDCADDSPALLDRLAAMGVLAHLRTVVPAGVPPQIAAYTAAAVHPLLARADWAMVLDADEFLNVHVGEGRVTDLIDAAPDATAFLVNWRIFGSSGVEAWTPGLVTERYTAAAPRAHGVNNPYKTLFTRIEAYGCKLLPHQPRFPHANELGSLRYVDGGGRALPPHVFDESRQDFLQTETGSVSWRLAQVNHYNTRSRDDYIVKHRRGGGHGVDWDRDTWWPVFDRNEERDVTILPKMSRAKPVLEAMLADASLRALHERSCRLYGEHLARLKAG